MSTQRAASGGMQWPDSPTSSAGSPTGRLTWRGGSLIDAALAATPAPGLGTAPPGTASGSSGGAGGFAPSTDVSSPLPQPEAALQAALAALQAAAASGKRELDWQAQYEALRSVRRLARHHPGVLAPSLHAAVLLAAPVLDALRSTLARLAIALFQVRGAGGRHLLGEHV